MDEEPTCGNCGIVIRWQPTIVDGKTFCCLGCAEGGPCVCDYDNLPQTGNVNPLVRHTSRNSKLAKPVEG